MVTTNKQDMAERFKLWFVQMGAGIYTGWYQGVPKTGWYQGLPKTAMTPLVHSEVVTSRHTIHYTQSTGYTPKQTTVCTMVG